MGTLTIEATSFESARALQAALAAFEVVKIRGDFGNWVGRGCDGGRETDLRPSFSTKVRLGDSGASAVKPKRP